MQNLQPKQITVNDLIQSDERVAQLKKTYEQRVNEKNSLILDISRVEADIIKTMGAFEYLNAFTDIEDEQKKLLAKFRALIVEKDRVIEAIKSKDINMQDLTKQYEVLANEIVKDFQKKFIDSQTQSGALESGTCGDGCPGCETCHKEPETPSETPQG